ncbi:MAG: MFS transporter [SAR202 cluster bacterium]|nr:MFS transporter [Chloroflexota bacterium]MQG84490.1 MFS transporter [SAR202 cluster bacterium]
MSSKSLNISYTMPIVLIGAAGLILISRGMHNSWGLLLIPLTDHLNVGREIYSIGIAFNVLFTGLGAPIFGALADKYGPGKAIFVGVILQLISQFWLSNVSSSFDLIGALLLGGFAAAGFIGIAMAAVGRSVKPENRSLFVGLVMASGGLGQFLITPLMNSIIQNSGWLTAIYLLMFFSSILIIFSYLISFSKDTDSNSNSVKQTVSEAFKEAVQNKNFNLLTLGFFVCGFHVTFIGTHFPAYLQDQDLGSIAGWSLALIGLFNIFGTLMYGYLGDRIAKKNLLVSIYTLRALVFLIFIFMPKTEFTVLFFAGTLGLLWLATVPLTSGVISDIFGSSFTSMLFGITLFSHNLGSVLGSWLGGRIFDQYQSYDVMWIACVVLGLLAALLHFPIKGTAIQRINLNPATN